MPFVRIYPEATTASALRDSAATRSVDAKNVQQVPVFANRRTNLLVKNVAWPDVRRTKIVPEMPSASRSPEVSVTALALQVIDPELTEDVKMSTSAARAFLDLAALEPCVKTSLDHFLAPAHLVHQEMLTTVLALLFAQSAHLIISVGKMKNVWLQESAFVHHLSSPTAEMETDAKVLAINSDVVSTLSARQQIHLSVYAKQVILEIL
jgi:hypothetical protein